MDAFLWAALGFLFLATVAGGVFAGVRTWRAWNAFVSLAAGGGAAAERLLSAVEQLAARGEHAASQGDNLLAAVDRLERSLARGRTLFGAVGEARDLVRAVTGLVPRK